MADETLASIIPLHQPKKARTGAERARAYRQRRRQKAKAAASPNHESPSSESLIPEDFSSEDSAFAEPPLTPPPTVTVLDVARDGDAPSRGNAKATPSVSYASCRNRGRVMASNIITQTSGSLVTPTRTDVATLMDTALAPFNLRDRWSEAIEAARKATPFVAVDDDDELVALGDNVDWPSSRARAVEIQQKLPPLTEITAACKAVDKTLRVKPVPEEYQILASKMLDVLGIRGGDDTDAYTEALAWTLADVWPSSSRDCEYGLPKWIPIPALAKAIKRVLEDRDSWEHFGGTKRPPIPDIVDRCKDYRHDLACVLAQLEMLGRTQERLGQIIQTVDQYEADGPW